MNNPLSQDLFNNVHPTSLSSMGKVMRQEDTQNQERGVKIIINKPSLSNIKINGRQSPRPLNSSKCLNSPRSEANRSRLGSARLMVQHVFSRGESVEASPSKNRNKEEMNKDGFSNYFSSRIKLNNVVVNGTPLSSTRNMNQVPSSVSITDITKDQAKPRYSVLDAISKRNLNKVSDNHLGSMQSIFRLEIGTAKTREETQGSRTMNDDLKIQLRKTTGDLAVTLLHEAFLSKDLGAAQYGSSQIDSQFLFPLKDFKRKLSLQSSSAEAELSAIAAHVTELKRRVDAQRVKRRHLLSKKADAEEGRTKLSYFISGNEKMNQTIKENGIEREAYRYTLISQLEQEMRKKAELEAMKAARESQWALEDDECSKLAERIDMLCQHLGI